MSLNLLKKAINRHFQETQLLVDQLTDELIFREPVSKGRPLGEIFLHIFRSIEFYLQGLSLGTWKPLSYDLKTYNSALLFQDLYKEIIRKGKNICMT